MGVGKTESLKRDSNLLVRQKRRIFLEAIRRFERRRERDGTTPAFLHVRIRRTEAPLSSLNHDVERIRRLNQKDLHNSTRLDNNGLNAKRQKNLLKSLQWKTATFQKQTVDIQCTRYTVNSHYLLSDELKINQSTHRIKILLEIYIPTKYHNGTTVSSGNGDEFHWTQ